MGYHGTSWASTERPPNADTAAGPEGPTPNRSLTMRPLKESLRGAGTSSAPHRAVRQPSAGLPAKLIFPNGSPDGLDFVGGERRNAAFIPELVRTGGPSVHGGSLPSIILTGGLNVETSD